MRVTVPLVEFVPTRCLLLPSRRRPIPTAITCEPGSSGCRHETPVRSRPTPHRVCPPFHWYCRPPGSSVERHSSRNRSGRPCSRRCSRPRPPPGQPRPRPEQPRPGSHFFRINHTDGVRAAPPLSADDPPPSCVKQSSRIKLSHAPPRMLSERSERLGAVAARRLAISSAAVFTEFALAPFYPPRSCRLERGEVRPQSEGRTTW